MNKQKRPELLSPAGNMERFETAIRYGADAVYVGAQSMSLRNFADNFSSEQLAEASSRAHALGKKVYVACNAFPRDEDLYDFPRLLQEIENARADALIVNDAGVIRMAKKYAPDMPLHLSTQANTLNSQAALFWHEQGISRIILARELSLEQIKKIRESIPDELELEMFVHGAMCVSYSGRCLLSNYFDGRDSNRGECVQPCRWSYEFRERGGNGEYYNIEQDEKGSFILNARDLNLIGHLAELIDAGICSLKIEGRMKSVAYVAAVTNAYAMALDAWEAGTPLTEAVQLELMHTSHRPFTTGFVFPEESKGSMQAVQSAQYESDMRVAALVLDYDCEHKQALIEQKNKFYDGDSLSILSPRDITRTLTVHGISDENGASLSCAPHPRQVLHIGTDEPLLPGDILRIIQNN